MRARTVLFALLAGSTAAVAQPGADLPPPEPAPEPAPTPTETPSPVEAAPPLQAPAPAEPAPVVVTPAAPAGTLPPITINITNNNNGNNSNTNTQTNSQANPQTNTQTNSQANPQTNTQTTSVPVNVTTSVAAPGAVAAQPGVRARVDHYELLRAKEKPPKWITLGVTTALHGPPAGIRGSIDLISRGAWSLGVAGAISHDGGGMRGHGGGGRGDGKPSAQAIGYLAWTGKIGRLDVRAQVGLGAGTSSDGARDGGRASDGTIARTTTGDPTTTDPSAMNDRHGHGRLGMRAEAAVLVGLPLGRHLGLVAGPVISAGKPEAGEKAVTAQVMGGLRWGF